MTPLTSYFTTNLSDEKRPESIVLPDLEQLKALLKDQEDAINSPTTNPSRNGREVYDLSGRKVQGARSKSLIIVNGKKVMIK